MSSSEEPLTPEQQCRTPEIRAVASVSLDSQDALSYPVTPRSPFHELRHSDWSKTRHLTPPKARRQRRFLACLALPITISSRAGSSFSPWDSGPQLATGRAILKSGEKKCTAVLNGFLDQSFAEMLGKEPRGRRQLVDGAVTGMCLGLMYSPASEVQALLAATSHAVVTMHKLAQETGSSGHTAVINDCAGACVSALFTRFAFSDFKVIEWGWRMLEVFGQVQEATLEAMVSGGLLDGKDISRGEQAPVAALAAMQAQWNAFLCSRNLTEGSFLQLLPSSDHCGHVANLLRVVPASAAVPLVAYAILLSKSQKASGPRPWAALCRSFDSCAAAARAAHGNASSESDAVEAAAAVAAGWFGAMGGFPIGADLNAAMRPTASASDPVAAMAVELSALIVSEGARRSPVPRLILPVSSAVRPPNAQVARCLSSSSAAAAMPSSPGATSLLERKHRRAEAQGRLAHTAKGCSSPVSTSLLARKHARGGVAHNNMAKKGGRSVCASSPVSTNLLARKHARGDAGKRAAASGGGSIPCSPPPPPPKRANIAMEMPKLKLRLQQMRMLGKDGGQGLGGLQDMFSDAPAPPPASRGRERRYSDAPAPPAPASRRLQQLLSNNAPARPSPPRLQEMFSDAPGPPPTSHGLRLMSPAPPAPRDGLQDMFSDAPAPPSSAKKRTPRSSRGRPPLHVDASVTADHPSRPRRSSPFETFLLNRKHTFSSSSSPLSSSQRSEEATSAVEGERIPHRMCAEQHALLTSFNQRSAPPSSPMGALLLAKKHMKFDPSPTIRIPNFDTNSSEMAATDSPRDIALLAQKHKQQNRHSPQGLVDSPKNMKTCSVSCLSPCSSPAPPPPTRASPIYMKPLGSAARLASSVSRQLEQTYSRDEDVPPPPSMASPAGGALLAISEDVMDERS